MQAHVDGYTQKCTSHKTHLKDMMKSVANTNILIQKILRLILGFFSGQCHWTNQLL